MGQFCENEAKKLLLEIDEKRKIMIMTAKDSGLLNEDTIKCSQELDILLNQYEKIKIGQFDRARLPHMLVSKLLTHLKQNFTRYKVKKVMHG